jgi:predicted DNA-binding transcriptional regulator YafY
MVGHNEEMLETSARLLRLLSLLQSGREWTGTELAERLQVTGRTVRADVERLRELGYPVHGNRGSTGGYRLGAGAVLPPLLLDDEEAVAVAIGLRVATGGALSGIEDTALRALSKLDQVLPARLRRRVTTLATYVVPVPRDRPGPAVDPVTLTTLTALCRDRERLPMRYSDHSGGMTRRTVEPYRVVNWGRRWYLVGWDVDREDWRTFRVDRMQLLTPTGPRFAPREPPWTDIAAYVAGRVSAAAWRYHARVTVHAPAHVVAERINPAVGTVEPVDDDTCVLETGSDSLNSFAVHLGLLDVDFTVTEPPELVEHLQRLAERYAKAAASKRTVAPKRTVRSTKRRDA